jgi:hypothetical protein
MLVLGPMGQMPGLSTYTINTIGFPLSDDALPEVIATLERAANGMVEAFPYFAGQVIVEKPKGETEPHSGIFKIVEYEAHAGKGKFVHVKDCNDLCPSFDELVAARAPTSILDGTVLSPAYGFAHSYPAGKVPGFSFWFGRLPYG